MSKVEQDLQNDLTTAVKVKTKALTARQDKLDAKAQFELETKQLHLQRVLERINTAADDGTLLTEVAQSPGNGDRYSVEELNFINDDLISRGFKSIVDATNRHINIDWS